MTDPGSTEDLGQKAYARGYEDAWAAALKHDLSLTVEIRRLREEIAALQHDLSQTYASLQGEMNARIAAEDALKAKSP